MTARSSRSGGFTLIEILITISILLQVMAILFPAIQVARMEAERAQSVAELNAIGAAISRHMDLLESDVRMALPILMAADSTGILPDPNVLREMADTFDRHDTQLREAIRQLESVKPSGRDRDSKAIYQTLHNALVLLSTQVSHVDNRLRQLESHLSKLPPCVVTRDC